MTAKLRINGSKRVFRLQEVAPARFDQFSPKTRAILRSMPGRIAQIKREREEAAARVGEFVADYKARHPTASVPGCPKGAIHRTTASKEEQ